MRAITIQGKLDMGVRDVPTPEAGTGEVRVRMAFGGICGSDLHYYFEGANGAFVVKEALTPGHEMSGTVDSDPSGVLAAGTPVTLHPATFGTPEAGLEDAPHLWPGGSYLGSASTWPHTQGGMSEYLVVRSGMIRVLPPELSLRRACLAEPLAVALHALTIAGDVTGARVLVSGSGPIGLLAVAAARARGAASVVATDVLAGPLLRARQVGANGTVQIGVEEIEPMAFDVALECTGVPAAIGGALVALRRRGILVQVGMVANEARPINLAPALSKELQLRGSFRFKDEIDEAVRMLTAQPELDQVITHEFAFDRAVEAFETAKDSEVSGKVVVAL